MMESPDLAEPNSSPMEGWKARGRIALLLLACAGISSAATAALLRSRRLPEGDIARSSSAASPPRAAPAPGKEDVTTSRVNLRSGVDGRHITLAIVREVRLAGDIQVTGNVSYDADHFAIVGPLVAGRVSRVAVGIGSEVRRGQIMAEIESVDVGQARGDLISARARLAAAESNLRRERDLADKMISSFREREIAEAQWATERAAVRAAHERLAAIGLLESDIEGLEERTSGGRVPVRSPIDGTVMERFVSLGQAIQSASDAFKVADLRRVWVQLDLYEKDLARIRPGLLVEARTEAYPGRVFKGRIAYVAPVVDEATRTAKVRVELENRERILHIGQLISARLIGDPDRSTAAVLAIPRSAVQRIDGKPLVFVKVAQGFERTFVDLGASGSDLIEIRRGLVAGQQIAADGGFLLKSELLR